MKEHTLRIYFMILYLKQGVQVPNREIVPNAKIEIFFFDMNLDSQ